MTQPLRRLVARARSGRPGRRVVGPRFEVVARLRPFELLSPGFTAVDVGATTSDGLVLGDWSPPAPYATVEVTPGDGEATVLAGLAAPDGDHLLAFLRPGDGEVGIELRTGGVASVLARARVRRRVRRLAFVLCENQPTVLVDTGRGWRPVATDRHRVEHRVDLRRPHNLARFTVAWGLREGTAPSGRVRAGLFGMVGLRDLHLVQHADGTPYVEDGRMFLTATCAGPGFFRQAHWGVFALDADALTEGEVSLEQTAHLFSQRDGMLLGDHAGQLVRDGDRWLVATSSWGDFSPHRGVHVRHAETGEDLLRGVHLLETRRTPLPSAHSTWDPGLTRVDGRWYVSYVESPSQHPFDFHPALAVGPAGAADWTSGLSLVGAVEELHACEGPVIARPEGPGGPWRLLTSDGHARRYRVHDLRMRDLGVLDAPYGSNIPHPQLVDLPDGSTAMVTFDGSRYAARVLGYGTHGDVVVMRAR